MTTEHLIILIIATPAFLFLFWIIKRLEDEIQRLRLQPHARHGRPAAAAHSTRPDEERYDRSA